MEGKTTGTSTPQTGSVRSTATSYYNENSTYEKTGNSIENEQDKRSQDIAVAETSGRETDYSERILQKAQEDGIEEALRFLAEDDKSQEPKEKQPKQKEPQEIFIEADEEVATNAHYDKWAEQQIKEGVPDEIKQDPLYQQTLGKAVTEAQENGEKQSFDQLTQKALATYKKEKDLEEELLNSENKEPRSINERVKKLEQDVSGLFAENKRLSETLKETQKQLEETRKLVEQLALLQAQLLAVLADKEKTEEEKQSLLQLLIELTGMLLKAVMGADEKAAKQAEKETKDKLNKVTSAKNTAGSKLFPLLVNREENNNPNIAAPKQAIKQPLKQAA